MIPLLLLRHFLNLWYHSNVGMFWPRFKFWLWAVGPRLVFWGCLACTNICLQLSLESRQEQGQLLFIQWPFCCQWDPCFCSGNTPPSCTWSVKDLQPKTISWGQPKRCPWVTTRNPACDCHLDSSPRVLALKVALGHFSFAKSAPTRPCLTVKTPCLYSVLTKGLAWVIWSCLFDAIPGLETPQCEG